MAGSQAAEHVRPQRIILITGCSSGIGAAAAHTLRGRDWRVFATARRQEDVDRLKDEGFESFRLDYQDEASISAAAAELFERTSGRLDALFNNGAYAIPGALEDIPSDALRGLFEANFFGWHTLTRAVVPHMRRQGHGRIVQCSSILGFMGMPYRGAYNASKFALEGYSDTLRLELAGTGIRVSLIEPGPIATRFTQNAMANFEKVIGEEGAAASPHREIYERRFARMRAGEPSLFKLPARAVVKRLVHAVEAPRPRARYRVTVPTTVMAGLKRLLPTRGFDWVLSRAARSEE
ncbi:SDR family oxidoreductase [Stappia sp. WLB 29]|uniref:SDR family oxidoreductase n=1 Tax=Stappia sp. WLB 29 TaxID=2925220 RepID=UPI0020BEE0CD|nr:SDR family oxidoreductase [Stappia sp. WLB 29]